MRKEGATLIVGGSGCGQPPRGFGRARRRTVRDRSSRTLVTRRAWVLAAGDLLALLLFASIGLLSHDRAVDLDGLARDWLPLAAGYTAAALLVHAWTRPGWVTLLRAWIGGVTAGVLARAVVLGRSPGGEQLEFLVVTLLVTLLLLVVWRALAALVRPTRRH